MNFQHFLNWVPRDKKLILPHPTVDVLSFYKGISKKFPYNFAENISTWIRQLCPCSLIEHFRYEGVFKGMHIDNPFHDDQGFLIKIIVSHVCLNALEVFWIRAWTLHSLLWDRVLSRRQLQKQTQSTKEQVQKHKTRTQT